MKPHRKQNNNPREWTSEISETRSRGILFLTAEYGQGKRGDWRVKGKGVSVPMSRNCAKHFHDHQPNILSQAQLNGQTRIMAGIISAIGKSSRPVIQKPVASMMKPPQD